MLPCEYWSHSIGQLYTKAEKQGVYVYNKYNIGGEQKKLQADTKRKGGLEAIKMQE